MLLRSLGSGAGHALCDGSHDTAGPRGEATSCHPRHAVYDFDFQTPDGQTLHKMVFLNW